MVFFEVIGEMFAELFTEGILRRLWSLLINSIKYTGIFFQMLFTGFQKPWAYFIKKSEDSSKPYLLGFFFYIALAIVFFGKN